MNYDLYRRAHESIAQGSLTNSKRLEILIKGVSPSHVTHGQGCYLFDADKKKYVDYICGLGTNLLGYGNPYIKKVVSEQLDKGSVFSLGSETEIEAAEAIKDRFAFVQKVRFLKTGTEAAMASVRIACAHTNRKKVLSSGYHGWSDGFVSLVPPHLGVAPQPHIEAFTSLDQIKPDVACVILEPIITDHSVKRLEWLQMVVDRCRKNDVLVIFDEIITGFRWPRLAFSLDSGIYPDIILLGKACGGGLPLSIIGLARGIGDNKEWFVSSTFGGDTLALVAMKETLRLLDNKYHIKDLWRDGGYFIEEFNELFKDVKISGYPTRGAFEGNQKTKALLWQEAARAGILFGPSWFYNFHHIENRKTVISAVKDIAQRISNNQVKLEGDMPSSPFAQKVRESA